MDEDDRLPEIRLLGTVIGQLRPIQALRLHRELLDGERMRVMVHWTEPDSVWQWVLCRVPRWFRSRWPLKRFYWQADELARAHRKGQELAKQLRWD